MSSLTATLFATLPSAIDGEERLVATAFLFEGSRPCWEIHIRDKVFRFIPNPDFLLEDGLWQLADYGRIPASEYQYDVHFNKPLTLEEEFGKEICLRRRKELARELTESGFTFSLLLWTGADERKMKNTLKQMDREGFYIEAHSWSRKKALIEK